MEILAGHVDRASVGQVTAVGQAHAHDSIAGLEQRKVDRHVGLRARVGLHVDVLRAKERLSAIPGQILHHVHVFAAAVVAVSRVAFGRFVG